MLFAFFVISACSSSVRFSFDNLDKSGQNSNKNTEKVDAGAVFYGKASYYGDEFNGRKTANGELYDGGKLTAAHKTLSFGTMIKVRNLNNNKEIVVRINDRGPFVSGRIVDLSYAAAKSLDMIRDGVVEVEITVIE
jgi:rare lipoprotein A